MYSIEVSNGILLKKQITNIKEMFPRISHMFKFHKNLLSKLFELIHT